MMNTSALTVRHDCTGYSDCPGCVARHPEAPGMCAGFVLPRTYHRPDPRHIYAGSTHARSRTVRDRETVLPACDRRPARQVSS